MIAAVAGMGGMPILNMRLSLGGEILTSEAKPIPDVPSALGQRERQWLRACAHAQRLAEANGSAAIFEGRALGVEISRAPPLAFLGEGGEDALALAGEAAFVAARALRALPAAAAPLARFSSWAHSMAARMREHRDSPVMRSGATLGDGKPPSLTVVLPGGSDALDPRDGMATRAPFWSAERCATYITLHEMGHAAQRAHGATLESYLGLGLLDEAGKESLGKMGLLERDPAPGLPLSCMVQFGECYADCFAALGLGGADAALASQEAANISRLRAQAIPAKLWRYSEGDALHDTREALSALREALRGAEQAPMGARAVQEMCLRCAQAGTARWAQSLAAANAGPLSGELWRHAGRLAALDANAPAMEAIRRRFDALVEAAADKPLLASLAKGLRAAPEAAKAAQALALLTLAGLEGSFGAPRVDLRGSRRGLEWDEPKAQSSARPKSLSAKISSRRELARSTGSVLAEKPGAVGSA